MGLQKRTGSFVDQIPDPSIPRQDHARLCRHAGDFGGEHGHLPISASSTSPLASHGYRQSVREADLARDIDRELISYRSLARYFVVTNKEDDSKAALVAEDSLKQAIIAAMKGTNNPARLDQVTKLEREFRAFTKIFAEIVKVKDESEQVAKNQLTRSGMTLRYKLDDLPSNADESEVQIITIGGKAPDRAVSGCDGACQYVRDQLGQDNRGECAGAPEVRRRVAEGRHLEPTTSSSRVSRKSPNCCRSTARR